MESLSLEKYKEIRLRELHDLEKMWLLGVNSDLYLMNPGLSE
jgi:hypothetical protein